MNQPSALVLAPVMPRAQDIHAICKSLNFLSSDYHLIGIDPLSTMAMQQNLSDYYADWAHWLDERLEQFDLFIGFSFGGVILQQCLKTLEKNSRAKMLLFSSPVFVDECLKAKLQSVIDSLADNQIQSALTRLYDYVYAPGKAPARTYRPEDEAEIKQRMIAGLHAVLITDSREKMQDLQIKTLHFVGEDSQLVNRSQIVCPPACTLKEIPGASMRVLEDKPAYCQAAISRWLADV